MPGINLPGPPNLGISRQMGVALALAGFCCVLMVVAAAAAMGAPMAVLLSITGIVATAIPGTVAALKATEAADSAAKAKNLSELSASQTATLQQQITCLGTGHALCADCPFRALATP